ncbi:putative NADP-dependent oxidoreductase domain-containing protein [Seiridium cardinale]|uniref:NADP-dependent oxidoreductase domain-containing protein n=1 Tax=Seiridium cardinale TaxID=138064 RepID=A0ABR2XG91_9PEZI
MAAASRVPKPDMPTGFGLMGMTWRPTSTPDEQAFAAMKAAIAKGATLWSSSEFYGMPEPTEGLGLLRRYFEAYPEDASKVTLFVKGCSDLTTLYPKNSRAGVRESIENTIKVLGNTKKIDIFGPARGDPSVPLEETIGTLKELVSEGLIGGIGLSEVGSKTIEKANSIFPLSLVEVEFSLWSTDILTNGVAETTKKLGIPIAAYAPLGRGFLTGQLKSAEDIPEGDIRRYFDRFQPENFSKNLELLSQVKSVASSKGVTPAQLALAWVRVHSKSDKAGVIIPIPGATAAPRVEENTTAVSLTKEEKANLDEILSSFTVQGGRYNGQLEATLWG